MRFTSLIRIRAGNPYLHVSAARARSLKPGWRKPLPVLVRLNGKPTRPWRINMMPIGNGGFYLYLHGDVRKASATRVGERVTAEVRFNAEYRSGPQHPLPRWFHDALRTNPVAMKNWDALIPSRKKEVLRYFVALKSPRSRARNLARALHVLAGAEARFMGRSWNGGV